MPSLADTIKRLVFGRKLRSENLGETLLPKRIALPIFASDALSSVAYATESALIVLVAVSAGSAHLVVPIAAAVVLALPAPASAQGAAESSPAPGPATLRLRMDRQLNEKPPAPGQAPGATTFFFDLLMTSRRPTVTGLPVSA